MHLIIVKIQSEQLMRKLLLFSFLFLITQITLAQLTIRIDELPANTPVGDTLFLAGNFQNWNPGDLNYQFSKSSEGYEIEVNPPAGNLEFKITRGSWASVEGNAAGQARPNRTYNYTGEASSLNINILSWEDLDNPGGNSTAQYNVRLLDDDFFMPQLGRDRRIWIYLPPDYDDSQKQYPVLYIHDGQNVFDAANSFSGEWQVDESLNKLFDEGDYGIIVVAIENGGGKRLDEYSPWINPNYGGGEGDEYMDFIVSTLKPYIDNNFRTRSDRKYNGLMGSSMGGLITMYGGIEYQEIFSKMGVFSPAYWFADQNAYNHVSSTGKEQAMKIYTIVGALEGNSTVSNVYTMESTLKNAGFTTDELNQTVHIDGQHSEWYWAREFPAAYEWLYSDLDLTSSSDSDSESFRNSAPTIDVFPNPVRTHLNIEGISNYDHHYVEIYDNAGRLFRRSTLTSNRIGLQDLVPGLYSIKILERDTMIFFKRVVRVE